MGRTACTEPQCLQGVQFNFFYSIRSVCYYCSICDEWYIPLNSGSVVIYDKLRYYYYYYYY